MFSNIFSVKNSNTLLFEMFKQINVIDKALPSKIEDFILNGNDPDVLITIRNINKEQLDLLEISLEYCYVGLIKGEPVKLSKQHILYRDVLLSGILIDPNIAKRFCLVFCEFSNSDYYYGLSNNNIEHWIKIFSRIASYIIKYENFDKKQYTGNWFFNVLEICEVPRKVIFLIFLDEYYSDKHNLKNRAHIFNTLNWKEFLIQDDFYSYIEELPDKSKYILMNKINQDQDINDYITLAINFLTDDSKYVRKNALSFLSHISMELLIDQLIKTFNTFSKIVKKEISSLIITHASDDLLVDFIKITEKENKALKELITQLTSSRKASKGGDVALVLPTITPFPKLKPIAESSIQKLIVAVNNEIKERKESVKESEEANKKYGWNSTAAASIYGWIKDVTESDVRDTIKCIQTNQGTPHKEVLRVLDSSDIVTTDELSIEYLFRILKHINQDTGLFGGSFSKWLKNNPNQLTDLRQLVPLYEMANIPLSSIAGEFLKCYSWDEFELPHIDGVNFWAFFYEYPEFLDEAFDLEYTSYSISRSMLMLLNFPSIPDKYLLAIYTLALSTSKSLGPQARETLNDYGLNTDRVIEALQSNKQEERIVAANWLADIKCNDAIPTFKIALKKEKKETVKAAMLSALHTLGESIDDYLSPKILLAEAQVGLKKSLPKSIEWFPFDSIPILKWNSGSKVELTIIKWWIVLSFKLKQPEGNPLLSLYIDQLDSESKAKLGHYILHIFIEKDIDGPNDDEANNYALNEQQSLFETYQYRAGFDWGEQYKNKTISDAYKELFKLKKSELYGSTISAKGILCLGSYINAADAVQILTKYMKDHYKRRHQIEALITSFASNNDPIAIQFLLSVARRNRTNSVQERAKALIEMIAKRNNWSHDELSDRTIPSAGFELNGIQIIELGSRTISVYLTEKLKIEMKNESGKVIKSLPAPREGDDLEQIKESKKQFSNIKKELKQVIDIQISRLHEAMCTNRVWTYSEWNEYILQHPILTHVAQKLIWMESNNGNDTLFRPTAERDLIDIEDNDVDIQDTSIIQLAHVGLFDSSGIKAWSKTLKEEKIIQPFKQLALPNHKLNKYDLENTKLNYHLGWVTDTFVVRSVLTKLGYKHGEAEDAGFFTHYFKDFEALNIRVIIEFSGNHLPEENIPAIVHHIAFVNPNKRGWIEESEHIKISDVQRSLVLEVMKDYEALAKKAHFDENWKSISPW
ncbi:MAG: DUF4132 domain-containing protein [Pseudomonadales bacterium]|nr:DUF4132 domain-containing protein [Pseudomonadales bacterium]